MTVRPLKVISVVGARPQIVKASAISRAFKKKYPNEVEEVIVHTGQHYDKNMSEVFFHEMGIPSPHYNLEAGSHGHAKQTAIILERSEEILLKEKPNFVVLFGDTNSTLAVSLAAIKLQIPIVHIEAGLRSFNKTMPEEINRIVCDHASSLLFTPTRTGLNNLIREGFKPHNKAPWTPDNPGVFHCGDVMYDNSLYFAKEAEKKSDILKKAGVEEKGFVLATIHRDNNTDQPERLNAIFQGILDVVELGKLDVVMPLHPRTSKLMEQNLNPELFSLVTNNPRFHILPPVSFFDILLLEKKCSLVMTDSGGLQKEAFFFKKPCIILRSETEWTEITESGSAIICDADTDRIVAAYEHFKELPEFQFPSVFGDGDAAGFICKEIVKVGKSK
ncbi:MAG: UDP-N-acetylglucosamine 2-epimerase (non-hydrolyzing) [Bacteroidetes bacterium]|nr:MAG: UDP-N-acetylglucosamine 2-epimerase (non-hydrolyzing) [Bacteroidota bacterium]